MTFDTSLLQRLGNQLSSLLWELLHVQLGCYFGQLKSHCGGVLHSESFTNYGQQDGYLPKFHKKSRIYNSFSTCAIMIYTALPHDQSGQVPFF